MNSDPRQTDRELRPHPDGRGWACPRCGEPADTFYGLPPNRRCKACTQARTTAATSEPVQPETTAGSEPIEDTPNEPAHVVLPSTAVPPSARSRQNDAHETGETVRKPLGERPESGPDLRRRRRLLIADQVQG